MRKPWFVKGIISSRNVLLFCACFLLLPSPPFLAVHLLLPLRADSVKDSTSGKTGAPSESMSHGELLPQGQVVQSLKGFRVLKES